jgi:exopolysaccharide biosynthesis polyprenyl glycosylphosphotransferase
LFGRGAILFAGDAVLLLLALDGSFSLRAWMSGLPTTPFHYITSRPWIAVFILAIYLFSFYVFDLYDPQSWPTIGTLVRHLSGAVLLSSFLILLYFWIAPFRFGRGMFLLNAVLLSAACLLWRIALQRIFRRRAPLRKIVLVGRQDERDDLDRYASSFRGQELAGFVLFDPGGAPPPRTGLLDEIRATVESASAAILAVSPRLLSRPDANRLILWARSRGIEVLDYPSLFEEITDRVAVGHVQERWILQSRGFRGLENATLRRAKRALDVLVSVAVLIISLPLMLLVAVLVKTTSRGPVFFIQDRVGEARTTYRILKFRTMIVGAEQAGPQWAEENDLRVTRLGRILRRTRIDELPQFLNVLGGSMSVVGPRPEREYFVRRLEVEIPLYSLRFVTKPGITGWAQIHYPYGASVEDSKEKLMLDLYYIRNFSLWLDVKIFLHTLRVMLFGLGR